MPPALEGASLVYVTDDEPGIRRERQGAQFVYLNARRRPIRDERILQRIRRLAIPPAYTDVWICRRANGHLQAVGRDARGRKQYRYHPDWRQARDLAKYDRMLAFSDHLPTLRRRVAADLRLPGLPRAKVLATVVRLLEASLIRVGNKEYARSNGSFGLTTLKNKHVRVRGERVQFRFRGKSGKEHDVQVEDARLARIVRRCQDLPGQALFQYMDDDGSVQDIGSDDVNGYIRGTAGTEFTAKDFRTWAGTVLAARVLAATDPPKSAGHGKAMIARAMEQVSQRLGNTPKICQKSYVHPAVLEAYLNRELRLPPSARARGRTRLSAQERAVQRLLRRRNRSSGVIAATDVRRDSRRESRGLRPQTDSGTYART